MKFIALIVIVVVAYFAGYSAHGQDRVGVEVVATGGHPAGTQWDGIRVYMLPIETTTVSPPDLEVCVVQEDIVCVGRVADGWSPRCPDSDKCRFEITVDARSPFGVMVFDIDALGQDVVSGTAGLVADLGQTTSGMDLPDWARSLTTGVGGLLSRSGRDLAEINAHRLEWMDAVIVAPDATAIPGDLADRMRSYAQSFARPAPFGDHAPRLSAPFDVQTIESCGWPGPPCLLGYTTIQFFIEETAYAD